MEGEWLRTVRTLGFNFFPYTRAWKTFRKLYALYAKAQPTFSESRKSIAIRDKLV